MALDCRPELATKPSMKAENIRCFGDVMHTMLDAYGKPVNDNNQSTGVK